MLTGLPKGACGHEQIEARLWSVGAVKLSEDACLPQIVLNYQPLNHSAGRLTLIQTLSAGGLVYFTRR